MEIAALYVDSRTYYQGYADRQALLHIAYTAEDGLTSEWTESFQLNMGLPLTVNVQDFFRPDWSVLLISLAMMSC